MYERVGEETRRRFLIEIVRRGRLLVSSKALRGSHDSGMALLHDDTGPSHFSVLRNQHRHLQATS